MVNSTASAPCKAILFGEHYVVYGSPALVLPIEPRNGVEFSEAEKGKEGVFLKSVFGEGLIAPDGSYTGVPDLAIFAEVAKAACGREIPPCTAKFVPGWKLKGVGSSASFCAAFAAGLFRLAGKKAGEEEIFSAAQAGELVAHGGKASGVDARCVSIGKPIVFRRIFSPPKYEATQAKFTLPAGCSLFIADTFAGKRGSTGELLRHFAGTFGISSAPQDASEEKRREVRDEFAPLWERIVEEMKKPSAEVLGALMNKNHALLRKRGVSSEGIERAVSAALSAGALGAKMTGAGGEGGAVLVLCRKEEEKEAMATIGKKTGFACHSFTIAKEGAKAS